MISLKGHIKGNLGAFGSLTGAVGKKQEQMELMLSSLYSLQYFLPAPIQNTVIDQMHLVQNEHRIIEESHKHFMFERVRQSVHGDRCMLQC
jgi:hypothetical protein